MKGPDSPWNFKNVKNHCNWTKIPYSTMPILSILRKFSNFQISYIFRKFTLRALTLLQKIITFQSDNFWFRLIKNFWMRICIILNDMLGEKIYDMISKIYTNIFPTNLKVDSWDMHLIFILNGPCPNYYPRKTVIMISDNFRRSSSNKTKMQSAWSNFA